MPAPDSTITTPMCYAALRSHVGKLYTFDCMMTPKKHPRSKGGERFGEERRSGLLRMLSDAIKRRGADSPFVGKRSSTGFRGEVEWEDEQVTAVHETDAKIGVVDAIGRELLELGMSYYYQGTEEIDIKGRKCRAVIKTLEEAKRECLGEPPESNFRRHHAGNKQEGAQTARGRAAADWAGRVAVRLQS